GGPLHVDAGTPLTLPSALVRAAAGTHGITYADPGGPVFQSYAALLDEARRMLGGLGASGLRPGDRAVVACASPRETLTAFWACVLGGVVPAVVSPRLLDDAGDGVARFAATWRALGRPPIVVSADAPAALLRLPGEARV